MTGRFLLASDEAARRLMAVSRYDLPRIVQVETDDGQRESGLAGLHLN
jgi:hypothetical protein